MVNYSNEEGENINKIIPTTNHRYRQPFFDFGPKLMQVLEIVLKDNDDRAYRRLFLSIAKVVIALERRIARQDLLLPDFKKQHTANIRQVYLSVSVQ